MPHQSPDNQQQHQELLALFARAHIRMAPQAGEGEPIGEPHSPDNGTVNGRQIDTLSTPAETPRRGLSSAGDSPSPSTILHTMRLGSETPATPVRKTPVKRRGHGTPDRFIPSATNHQSFRMGAPAENLSSEERLLRRHVDNPAGRDRSMSPDRRNAAHARDEAARGSPFNRRLSAGAIGVFGIGIMPQIGPVDLTPTSPRPRIREVGGIFSNKRNPAKELEEHAFRVSAALGIDRSRRVLTFSGETNPAGAGNQIVRRGGGFVGSPGRSDPRDVLWAAVGGDQNGNIPRRARRAPQLRIVPTTPFRVLDAPGLRDDYYCSLLAYSPTTHSLAVGLHSDVYSWSESSGAVPFQQWSNAHVTSLAFSTKGGNNNILAIGRISGSLTLWTPKEKFPRFEQKLSSSIACLAWKPQVTPRCKLPISDIRPDFCMSGYTEDLLVGDEAGNIHFYQVNWGICAPEFGSTKKEASMTLVRRIVVHTQQICGLAWSIDGSHFASGGNDNAAFLFVTSEIEGHRDDDGMLTLNEQLVLHGGEKHRWQHGAAVKAIAFCPWQKTLLATGGGSNDRCVHFYHTRSGGLLNTVNLAAQVTSLIWSTTRQEIAATLGYANPDHPVRIVVINWPECQHVVQVHWQEDMRALYAISYPGGPAVSEGSAQVEETEEEEILNENQRLLRELGAVREPKVPKKRMAEGCIVVAASDETVRFHEIWAEGKILEIAQGVGVLGGSEILEGIEGIHREGSETIR